MQVLRVFPNPFAATDRDGVPCAVCPRDPDADGGGPASFVGARVCRKGTQILQDFSKQGRVGKLNIGDYELRSPMQRTRYEYLGIQSTDPKLAELLSAKEPIELPATKYYKDRLREGALLPADAATARAAKLTAFIEPKTFFARYVRTQPVEAPEVKAAVVETTLEETSVPPANTASAATETPEATATAEAPEARNRTKRRQESTS